MKPEPHVGAQGSVAESIRCYLAEHPQAADTAEGIQRWWLVPMYGEVSLGSVQQALSQLEGAGVVCKLDPHAREAVFGRCPGPAGKDGQ
jgi:Fe2+ or Zn2+ uptake regulation protein